jgi:hypothetical protein
MGGVAPHEAKAAHNAKRKTHHQRLVEENIPLESGIAQTNLFTTELCSPTWMKNPALFYFAALALGLAASVGICLNQFRSSLRKKVQPATLPSKPPSLTQKKQHTWGFRLSLAIATGNLQLKSKPSFVVSDQAEADLVLYGITADDIPKITAWMQSHTRSLFTVKLVEIKPKGSVWHYFQIDPESISDITSSRKDPSLPSQFYDAVTSEKLHVEGIPAMAATESANQFYIFGASDHDVATMTQWAQRHLPPDMAAVELHIATADTNRMRKFVIDRLKIEEK